MEKSPKKGEKWTYADIVNTIVTSWEDKDDIEGLAILLIAFHKSWVV